MTPAINFAKKHKIEYQVHAYEHDPAAPSFGLEAAEKLSLDPARVFKTLVVELDGKELAVAVIPVNAKLDLKRFAKAMACKKAAMAEQRKVERSTGYVLGGVSPLGQKKPLKTLLDESARQFPTIFVSAGRRGLDIELKPDDLVRLTQGGYSRLYS
ncbi:MAG: Cys-tRNA(Pro) deacylase [Chromatiales bacterium]|jgi:Cys-tRNA(Pro)/Cys-tRNA(Cys) deacylase